MSALRDVPPFNPPGLPLLPSVVKPVKSLLDVRDGQAVLSAGVLLVERLDAPQGEGQDVIDLAPVDPHVLDGPTLANEGDVVGRDPDVGQVQIVEVVGRCVGVGVGPVSVLPHLFWGQQHRPGELDVFRPFQHVSSFASPFGSLGGLYQR